MADNFYRGTLTSAAVISELAGFLETHLHDTGDTYSLSGLLSHAAFGLSIQNGSITQTDNGYIVDIDGAPFLSTTISTALQTALPRNLSSLVGIVGTGSFLNVIFGNNFESDTQIIDSDGNLVAGVYSESSAGEDRLQSLLTHINANDYPMVGSHFTVRSVSDVENPSSTTSSQYLVDTTGIEAEINGRTALGDFLSWNVNNKPNSDHVLMGTNYFLLDSLDSDVIAIEYHDGNSAQAIAVSWNDIDVSGSGDNYKIYFNGKNGSSGNDIIFGSDSFEEFIGGEGVDTVFGFEGDDTFEYVSGYNYRLVNQLDGDTYHGGYEGISLEDDGSDTVDYSALSFSGSDAGVAVSLNTGEAQRIGTSTIDTLISIENVIGSDKNDVIHGDENNNILTGMGGADVLYGLAGDDTFLILSDDIEGSTYEGGNGVDTIKYGYNTASQGFYFTQTGNNTAVVSASEGASTVDAIIGIEYYILTDQSDSFQTHLGNSSDFNLKINGYWGADSVIYDGAYHDYSVERGYTNWGGSSLVVDYDSGTRQDVLSKVGTIEFSDGSYSLFDGFTLARNHAPTSNNDIASVVENGSVNISILDNDYDSDGDLLSIITPINANNGSVQILLDGTITYTPNAGFAGLDNFEYTVSDPDGLTSTARVYVHVGDGFLLGSSGSDTLSGGGADDVINGDAGDDTLIGSLGSDLLYGGAGNDSLNGGVGSDIIHGGAGNDSFYGSDSSEQYFGGTGSDKYYFDMSVDGGSVGINEYAAEGFDTIFLTNIFAGNRIEFQYDSNTDQLNSFYFSDDIGVADFAVSINATAALSGNGVETISLDGNKAYTTKNIINAAKESVNDTFIFDIEAYEVDGYLTVLPETSSGLSIPVVQDAEKGSSVYADWSNSGSFNKKLYAEEYFQGISFTGGGNPNDLTPDVNGVYSAPVIGYIQTLDFHAGISRDDIRLTLDNQSNAGLDIHIDSLGVTYHYDYFEDGYTINSYGFTGGNISGAGSGGQSGSYTFYGDNLLWENGFSPETYFFQKILFAGGSEINLRGALTFEGTDIGETLYGLEFADRIIGNGGSDIIYAYGGDDTLIGGTGTDTLWGGIGDDTYVYNVGDGTDTLVEGVDSGFDTIHLAGAVDPNSYRLYSGQYGVFGIESKLDSTDKMQISSGYTNEGGLSNQSLIGDYFEQVTFDDGTIWDLTGGITLEGDAGIGDAIFGTGFGDTIYGYGGADNIYGNAGDDTLIGGTANDTLRGGIGIDEFIFEGGFGNDQILDFEVGEKINISSLASFIDISDLIITGNSAYSLITIGSEGSINVSGRSNTSWTNADFTFASTILGTTIGEALSGGSNADHINGLAGLDYLTGNGGNDVILGGYGEDRIYGNDGDDILNGERDNDRIYGHLGNDTIYGGHGWDLLLGLEGDDIIWGGIGDDVIRGDDDAALDNFVGAGNDELHGEDGKDKISGGAGDDVLYGDDGNDTLYGNAGEDTLYGGNDVDRLYGYGDNDILYGEAGNDYLYGGLGDDTLDGGAGADRIYGNEGNDTIHGGDGNDYLYGLEDNDTINGDAGVDRLYGNAGDDIIDGGADNDLIWGAEGADTLYGGDGADRLIGDDDPATSGFVGAGNDTLYGQADNDILGGGAGDDTLYGGTGVDALYGNDGADTFAYQAGDIDGTMDYIHDFSFGESDVIDISDVIDFDVGNGDAISDFVFISNGSYHAQISIDQDGTGTAFTPTIVTQIQSNTGLDLNTMVTNGSLIVE
jgi:Ca2+-binding RTX toxin-like protein